MIETTGSAVRPSEATLRRLANSCERLAGREDQARAVPHDLDADDYRLIAGLLRELVPHTPSTFAAQDAATPSLEAAHVVSVGS